MLIKPLHRPLGLILLTLISLGVAAQNHLPPRPQIGVSLLPAFIAADQRPLDIDPTAPITIYLVHDDQLHAAELVQSGFNPQALIRNRSIQLLPVSIKSLVEMKPLPNSTLFLTIKPANKYNR